MKSIYSGRFNRKLIAIIMLSLGVLFIMLGAFQTTRDIEGYFSMIPTVFVRDGIKVYISNGEKYIVEAFSKAVEDWNKAVLEFNYVKDLECSLRILIGCRSCLMEPRLPTINVVKNDEYNVVVEFRDSMPEENLIAYTEPYINGSLLARIVIWSKVPEHRAYQVSLHEISRLYGIDIPRVYRTLFGAVPAGSNTEELNPSIEQFMNGPPDPMKPTTLDLNIAYEGLRNLGKSRINLSGIVFRAYDEPDFTILAFTTSPILITLGIYILSRRDIKFSRRRFENVLENS